MVERPDRDKLRHGDRESIIEQNQLVGYHIANLDKNLCIEDNLLEDLLYPIYSTKYF